MIKYALPAAVAVLALGSPLTAQAQVGAAAPMMATPPAMPAAPVEPGTEGYYGGYQSPVALVAIPPGTVWIPGHYDWDPASRNYTWADGGYAQPPHPGAQWVAGHWTQTADAWIWINDHWN